MNEIVLEEGATQSAWLVRNRQGHPPFLPAPARASQTSSNSKKKKRFRVFCLTTDPRHIRQRRHCPAPTDPPHTLPGAFCAS